MPTAPLPDIADLIRSIASLLWSVLGFLALFCFRKDIAVLMARISKAKVFGHEFELQKHIKELYATTQQLPNTVRVRSEPEAANKISSSAQADVDHTARRIYEYASTSPRIALLFLDGVIKSEASDLLASTGKWTPPRDLSFSEFLKKLDRHYGLPASVKDSLWHYERALNAILHGESTSNERILLSAVDSGIEIYSVLHMLPRDQYWIHHEGVAVYSDQECSDMISGVKGIILTVKSRGDTIRKEIVPSTKLHFKKGKQVSWEWNMDKVFQVAWYRDPESGGTKRAWNREVEFVGRIMDPT